MNNRRSQFRSSSFNLIEVVLALVVVAIGMLSIVGLIPIGAKATRNAVGNSYAADTADYMLHYISALAKQDWAKYIDGGANALPDEASKPSVDEPALPPTIDTVGWTQVPNTTDLYYSQNYPGTTNPATEIVYRLYRTRPKGNGEVVTDFDAIITIWKSPSSTYSYNGTNWITTADSSYDKRAQLNIEISWPAALEYKYRHHTSYVLEVVR